MSAVSPRKPGEKPGSWISRGGPRPSRRILQDVLCYVARSYMISAVLLSQNLIVALCDRSASLMFIFAHCDWKDGVDLSWQMMITTNCLSGESFDIEGEWRCGFFT